MKDLFTLLSEIDIVIPEDKKEAFNKSFLENYKTINDYNKQKEKLDSSEEKVKTLTESLDKFKDVDPAALHQTIEDLRTQLSNKDAEVAQKLADRDFDDLLNTNIHTLKGKNVKAIKALLDVEALKQSKNQAEDIKTV